MKTVAITGATGVVGSRALQHLLARGDVGQVVALGRRVLELQHPKLVSRVADLQQVEAMVSALPESIDAAICGLGTTMKQAGSKEAFRAVDYDAVVNFGKAALQRGAKRFVLVSAIGSNARSSVFYSRTKGEAEDALAKLGFAQVTFLRPSFIDDQGTRKDDRLGERLGLPIARALFSVVGKTHRYAPITSEVLGKAAVTLAFDEPGDAVRVVEGEALFRAGA